MKSMENRSEIIFRPFMDTPEPVRVPERLKKLSHPLFAWARLRPIFAQHTSLEHNALQRGASGCHCVVEIGVAEGASALALRLRLYGERWRSVSDRPLSSEPFPLD